MLQLLMVVCRALARRPGASGIERRGGGCNRIPEADIDLDVDPRFSKVRLHHGADTAIGVVLPDRVHLETVNVEHQTIVLDVRGRDIPNGRCNCCLGSLAQTKQIQIAGRPVPLSDADPEQPGSF